MNSHEAFAGYCRSSWCSRTTVSNVLHGNTKKVSKEMIRKISEILNQEAMSEYIFP